MRIAILNYENPWLVLATTSLIRGLQKAHLGADIDFYVKEDTLPLVAYNKKVKANELPNWFLKIFSLFDKPTRMIIDELGFCAIISNEKMKNDLCIQPISSKQAVQATATSLVEIGRAHV